MKNPLRYFNSSPEVIRLAVMMYIRYPLSLRQVEDLLFERGIDICHETVRFWWNRFGPMFAAEIRMRRVHHSSYSQWRWRLDEVFVKINGETHYLWRAVDHEGEVLEVFATKRRDRRATLKFLKRAMKRYGRPGNLLSRGRDAEIAARRKEQNQVDRKLDALIEAIAEGFRSNGLQAKLTVLESRRMDLERALTEAPPPAPRLHPNLATLYRRKVERLHEALADPAVRDEALAVLRSLIESVVLHPREDSFTIELVGEIANMVTLALTADSKKAALCGAAAPDVYRRSVKVVAGARNHLYLLFAVPHLFLSNDELEIYNPFYSNVRFRRLHDR